MEERVPIHEAVKVNVRAIPYQITEVNDEADIISGVLLFNFGWTDTRLSFESKDPAAQRYRSSKDIWTPDIVLINAVRNEMTRPLALIGREGDVFFTPMLTFSASCQESTPFWFPFDTRVCGLKFSSASTYKEQMTLTMDDKHFMSDYKPHGKWKISRAEAKSNEVVYPCCPETYQDVTITMHLNRLDINKAIMLIVPGVVTAGLSVATIIQNLNTKSQSKGSNASIMLGALNILCVTVMLIAASILSPSGALTAATLFFALELICISVLTFIRFILL